MSNRERYPRLYEIETFRKWTLDQQVADVSTYTVAANDRRQAVKACNMQKTETVLSIKCLGRITKSRKGWGPISP